jgi:Ca-activated chloride channel family protein
MLTFAFPWLFLLAPLPLALRLALPAHRERRLAVRGPWFERLAAMAGKTPGEGAVVPRRSRAAAVLFALLWASAVIALARPQFLEPPITRVLPARDLLLLVDLSGSMETEDFTDAAGRTVDRLTAVKEVLGDFLTRREGDRVGLIVFGNAAFVQVPFTQDLEACRLLLEETAPRMAGPRTSLGDAIGLGITLFERSALEQRVMIALTDGNDTGSQVPPAEAARIAADHAVAIHTVAVGDPAAAGEEKLDEEALRAVARTTGGRYFHAADRAELEGIYAELDALEVRELETESHRPRLELYHWPLGLILVATLAFFAPRALRR